MQPSILRMLWETDGPVGFEGEFIAFDLAHFAPTPLQRPLPLWIGDNGIRGWRPFFIGTAEMVESDIRALAEARARQFSTGNRLIRPWILIGRPARP